MSKALILRVIPGQSAVTRAAERPHEAIYRRHSQGNAPDSPVARADDYVTKVSDERSLDRSLRVSRRLAVNRRLRDDLRP